MQTLERKNKTYLLDDDGFLVNPGQWDEDFAEGMAPALGIADGLTPSHWDVLRFIRATYLETGSCPLVYEICRAHKLRLAELKGLFPFGYQRGACKLAGLSFMAEGGYPLRFIQDQRPQLDRSPSTNGFIGLMCRVFLSTPMSGMRNMRSSKPANYKWPALSAKNTGR